MKKPRDTFSRQDAMVRRTYDSETGAVVRTEPLAPPPAPMEISSEAWGAVADFIVGGLPPADAASAAGVGAESFRRALRDPRGRKKVREALAAKALLGEARFIRDDLPVMERLSPPAGAKDGEKLAFLSSKADALAKLWDRFRDREGPGAQAGTQNNVQLNITAAPAGFDPSAYRPEEGFTESEDGEA